MRPVFWLVLVLALTACASVPKPDAVGIYPASTDRAWQFQGRVAVTRGEEGWHASLHWHQDHDAYTLSLSGPFGQGGVLLEGNADSIRMQNSSGQIWHASDAESLLEKATGWRLPVSGLRYWVRGMPEPQSTARVSTDENGRIIRLVQSGWDIRYERHLRINGRDLPSRMQLETHDLSVRLVIDQWLPLTPDGTSPGAASSTGRHE